MDYEIRKLHISDLNIYYFYLLNQLSIGSLVFDENKFTNLYNKLDENQHIYVIIFNSKIIGTVSILIEQKLLRHGGKVGHIEDLIIDKCYKGKGIGTKLVDFAVDFCNRNDCYKCILNCKNELKSFYEKSSFKHTGCEMSIYF